MLQRPAKKSQYYKLSQNIRCVIFDKKLSEISKEFCMKVENLYQIKFLRKITDEEGITTDENPIHLLV